ncbi:MAG: PLDc N-terminal domain-containing protein [Acidimicrobiia bacterium]|nr:PLDc N-terminal domain-containing protein [Acidimicrobiia bacterium]
MQDIPWAAVAPLLVLLAGFLIYCLIDLARSEVQYLPKWAWAIICVISVPLGGVIYLTMGRKPRVE